MSRSISAFYWPNTDYMMQPQVLNIYKFEICAHNTNNVKEQIVLLLSSLFFQNQLDAYMQWINSQLKKKPGARLVEDLRHDTRDGVAFIDLISVIGMTYTLFVILKHFWGKLL